jgi:hypothetical protein
MGITGKNALRVLRGGSWNNNRRNCRAAYRNRNDPVNFNNNVGFRVALSTLCERIQTDAVSKTASVYCQQCRTDSRSAVEAKWRGCFRPAAQ